MNKVQQGVDLIDSMTDDELNQLIDYIRASIKTRHAQRNARAKAALSVGTRVRLAGLRKPQYLQGLTGEVVELRQTRALVKLDCGPVGKFYNGRVLTAAGSLEVL
jgi:hypothetical protein